MLNALCPTFLILEQFLHVTCLNGSTFCGIPHGELQFGVDSIFICIDFKKC
jgi:hypothetical protein